MSRKYRYAKRGRFFFFPLIAIVFLLAMGGIVMFLWNAILPDLVGVNAITYWQAVGLLLLSRILFGNFGKGGPFGSSSGSRHPRHHWREKWQKMSPEERTEMKEKWKKWWDRGRGDG